MDNIKSITRTFKVAHYVRGGDVDVVTEREMNLSNLDINYSLLNMVTQFKFFLLSLGFPYADIENCIDDVFFSKGGNEEEEDEEEEEGEGENNKKKFKDKKSKEPIGENVVKEKISRMIEDKDSFDSFISSFNEGDENFKKHVFEGYLRLIFGE